MFSELGLRHDLLWTLDASGGLNDLKNIKVSWYWKMAQFTHFTKLVLKMAQFTHFIKLVLKMVYSLRTNTATEAVNLASSTLMLGNGPS